MRLISQNGKFDIPYDEIVVELFGECVVCRLKEYIGRDIILGSYSTEAKAQKAMEMLRDAYSNYDFCINLTTENMLKSYAMSRTKEEFMKYAYPYFQFPQDEDVEV